MSDIANCNPPSMSSVCSAENADKTVALVEEAVQIQARTGVRQHPRHADFNTLTPGAKALKKLPVAQSAVNSASTDDLLHFVAVMVNKATQEPETSHIAAAHMQRAFDRLVERIS